MSWKRVSYIFVVMLVAGFSAISGGVVGGVVVYQAMNQDKSSNTITSPQTVDVVPASANNTDQVLTVIPLRLRLR